MARPESAEAVVDLMGSVGRRGGRLTLRGAGGSFHDHSLPRSQHVSTSHIPREMCVDGRLLSTTGPVSYEEALPASIAAGCLVPIVPTVSRIPLAGGPAADASTRFSCLWGKASDSLIEVELHCPNQERILVRRPGPSTDPRNDELFRALPGSFGFLGYVHRIRSHLLPNPAGQEAPRVETEMTLRVGFDALVDELVAAYMECVRGHAPSKPNHGCEHAGRTATWALTNTEGLGAVFRSSHVAADRPLRRLFLHHPNGMIHQAGQLLTIGRVWSRLGWEMAWRGMRRRAVSHRFVDDLLGFHFMMDGNWRARRRMSTLGISAWLLQQSYLIPIDPTAPDPGRAARDFMERSRKRLRDRGIMVDCYDLLLLPADDRLLSASYQRGGILISIACQGLSRRKARRFGEVLAQLSGD